MNTQTKLGPHLAKVAIEVAKQHAQNDLAPMEGPRFAAATMRPDQWPTTEPPAKWAVPGLRIGVGRPNLFNGPGGIGKSLVAQDVIMCALGGVAGLGGIIAAGPPIASAVHVDGDQGGTAARVRYHRLGASLGVMHRPTLFILEDAVGFDPRSVADWTEVFTGHQLAVVDSLSSLLSFAGLEENSPKDTKAILTALRAASERTGCAVILITHSGHDIEDKAKAYQRKRPRGSSAIIQGAGTIWTFTGTDERGSTRTAWQTRESEQDDGSDFVMKWSYRITTTDAKADAVGGIAGLDVQIVSADDAKNDAAVPDDVSEAIVWALDAAPEGLSLSALSDRTRRGKKVLESALADLAKEGVIASTQRVVKKQPIKVFVLLNREAVRGGE